MIRKWRADGGDEHFRYTYDLNEDSVVFDVGGYEGDWAEKIVAQYHCRIHVFEPVKAFADAIRDRFAENPKIEVHAFGLGGIDRDEPMAINRNASSIYKSSDKGETVHIANVAEWIRRQKIKQIDLIKINIEGGEFELLERLIAENMLELFSDIQVQFHSFAPDADARMEAIHQALAKTHSPSYAYRYIWENWYRKA